MKKKFINFVPLFFQSLNIASTTCYKRLKAEIYGLFRPVTLCVARNQSLGQGGYSLRQYN